MGLVLDWQKKLGYRNDPFESTYQRASKFLVGTTELQERVNLFLIKDERFGTVSGDKGTGKTMFLQWMNEQLAPQKTHAQHYLDGAAKKEELITELLQPRLTFFEKINKAPLKLPLQEQEHLLIQRLAKEQKNVLLIDNAGQLGKQESEFLTTVMEKTPTHIVLADTEDRLKKLTFAEDRLKIKMPNYTLDQLSEMLRRRIEAAGGNGTFPFDEEELKSLAKRADHNPAKLLHAARERAIELSLKVQHPVPAPQPKGGFLSIKVKKGEEKAKPESKPAPQASLDAAALSEMLEESKHPHNHAPIVKKATPPPQEDRLPVKIANEHHETAHKTKHDKVVEQVIKNLAKPKAKKKR